MIRGRGWGRDRAELNSAQSRLADRGEDKRGEEGNVLEARGHDIIRLTMPFVAGAKLEAYEVLGLLGAGGMGEVYRAYDPVLKREVAIKVIGALVLNDPDLRRRFEKEAQAAAALNHPNILAVHHFGIFEGAPYLVSELLIGDSLRQVLERGPMPIRKVIDTAVQVSDGMAAAHNRGIVHRDLKPENLFVLKDGRVKILDFGLAKLMEPQAELAATDATISYATQPGAIMGTVSYMSPEQVRGATVDARSDIFTFGAILYEMLASRRAFQRPTAAETMTAILNEDPAALSEVSPAVSPGLQRIVQRCMEKSPEQRFQSASDLAFALKTVSDATGLGIEADRSGKGSAEKTLAWPGRVVAIFSAAALAIVALVVVGLVTFLKPSQPSGLLDSTQITFSADPKSGPVFTDGSRLYFDSGGEPSEMSVTGGPIVPLRVLGEGLQILDISTDGSKVVASKPDVNDNNGRGTLWTGSMLGGSPRKLSDHLALVARWSPDGRYVLFSDQQTLYRIDPDGENLQKVWTGPGELSNLNFSPDGQNLTVTLSLNDERQLWGLSADGRNAHRMKFDWPEHANQYNGRWTPDGRHFFFSSDREGSENVYELMEPRWFEPWKKPSAVRVTGNQLSIRYFTPTRDGNGLYVLGLMDEGAMRAYDPASKKLVPYLENLSMLEFAISPDHQWMAYSEYPSRHLWKSRLDGSDKVQLTDSYALMQQWSPDGKWLVYSDWKNLYRVSADGGAPEKLTPDGHGDLAPTWFPDGKSIAFSYFPHPGLPLNIHVLDLASRQVSTMPNAEGYFWPSWSPDGNYLVAIAENPSRMVMYSAKTKTWKDLHVFDAVWSYWTWAADSQSLFMSHVEGNKGIYQLTVPEGKWTKLSGLEGVNDPSGFDSFLSLTPQGQPAIMSRTGVAQLYLLHWNR
jgi:serine/threonine protein kinase/Tol biopolymer transport system component